MLGKTQAQRWADQAANLLLGSPFACRLLVQMEEDSETLEFNASAGDLLRVESDNEVGNHQHIHMHDILILRV